MEANERRREIEATAIPVVPNGKQPAIKNWQEAIKLDSDQRIRSFKSFGNCNVGLLAGTSLSTGNRLAFMDVDQPGLVQFIRAVLLGKAPCKVGKNGGTFFCQFADDVKSRKFKAKGQSAPAVEIFASSGQTVSRPQFIRLA